MTATGLAMGKIEEEIINTVRFCVGRSVPVSNS